MRTEYSIPLTRGVLGNFTQPLFRLHPNNTSRMEEAGCRVKGAITLVYSDWYLVPIPCNQPFLSSAFCFARWMTKVEQSASSRGLPSVSIMSLQNSAGERSACLHLPFCTARQSHPGSFSFQDNQCLTASHFLCIAFSPPSASEDFLLISLSFHPPFRRRHLVGFQSNLFPSSHQSSC